MSHRVNFCLRQTGRKIQGAPPSLGNTFSPNLSKSINPKSCKWAKERAPGVLQTPPRSGMMHKRCSRTSTFECGTPATPPHWVSGGRTFPASQILRNFDNEMHVQCLSMCVKMGSKLRLSWAAMRPWLFYPNSSNMGSIIQQQLGHFTRSANFKKSGSLPDSLARPPGADSQTASKSHSASGSHCMHDSVCAQRLCRKGNLR